MKTTILALIAASTVIAGAAAPEYTTAGDWIHRPEGLGIMHGDLAVSASGEVYVSVQVADAALQVYAPDGTFLRNVPDAPNDLHGFVIRRQPDGEFLFGVRLRGQSIVKMTLDGHVVMTIPASAIPDDFKVRNARSGQLAVALTGVDVAPNGDLYVADGYASDFIHRFDRTGKCLSSFGGRKEPYSFNTLHKLTIDTRFTPVRIIACDRANNRVVHLSLAGEFLGVVAKDLLLPAAVAISGDDAIVGELRGQVTILDKTGAVVTRLGTNTGTGIGTNQVPPDQWRPGVVVAPHGVAVNGRGDLFVSEFNSFGRVHRFNRQQSAGGFAGTGTLRATFLATNPVQARIDAQTGAVTGPVADLARELASRLGVPFTITPVPDAAAVIDSVKTHRADIGFLAIEAARATQVEFSQPYALMANAYAVRADSKIRSSAEIDRAGVKVGATRGQSQEIYVSGHLKNARVTVFPAMPPNEALAGMLASGELDAFAANRTRMEELARASSQVRVLADNFLMIGQAIVVDKGDAARVGELNRFVSEVVGSGFMKASLDRTKLSGVEVAPLSK